MKEQAFAAVEKSEPKKVIVDERCNWTHDDVEEAESAVAFGDRHFGAERGVAVHVVDVVGEGRVGVVEEIEVCALIILHRRIEGFFPRFEMYILMD